MKGWRLIKFDADVAQISRSKHLLVVLKARIPKVVL
jgi:hypothetical protein